MAAATATEAASANQRPRPLANRSLPTNSSLLSCYARRGNLGYKFGGVKQHRLDRGTRDQYLRGAGRFRQQLPLAEEDHPVIRHSEILVVHGVVGRSQRDLPSTATLKMRIWDFLREQIIECRHRVREITPA